MVEHFLQGQILFGQVSPEVLLENLLENNGIKRISHHSTPFFINSKQVSEKAYLHFSRIFAGNARRTVDEQLQRYHELHQFLSTDRHGGVFCLLADYGNRVLNLTDFDPKVKQEKILEWRETSLALGQDIFTCAALAEKDIHDKIQRRSFSWSSAIQTDNIPLRYLLESGCAENHYHLNGSTQIFPLAWCYLMNHPSQLTEYFTMHQMQDNLSARIHTNIRDNMIDWVEKMSIAAWVRVKLFSQIFNTDHTKDTGHSFVAYYHQPDKKYQLYSMVKRCRWKAAKLPQGRKAHCLDYAITASIAKVNQGPTRLLAGERSFLYHCFYRCYAGKFTQDQMDLLYLYLLIKREFRNELVQTNGRRGFWNFSDYQDRKAMVWGKSPAYWWESYVLSLAENLTSPRTGKPVLQTLEARVIPGTSATDILSYIRHIDSTMEQYQETQVPQSSKSWPLLSKKHYWRRAEENSTYFYVMHFAKKPLESASKVKRNWKQWLPPRNHDVRKKAEYQAKALAKGLIGSSYLCSRIRGIDACSREIGCRPETFATQFRYLRGNLVPNLYQPQTVRYWPKLRATYHVGEDFLDLTDGLRAIDEAICFLNLSQGDRLGHALALGISPQQYYRVKDNTVWLPAQDLLDNLVWLLHRSLEWDIEVPGSLRENLRLRAQQLLDTIYPSKGDESTNITLRTYYEAWHLRSDDPELYWNNRFGDKHAKRAIEDRFLMLDQSYKRAMLDRRKDSKGIDFRTLLRRSNSIFQTLFRYHFGYKERVEGEKPVCFVATPDYATVLEQLQVRMMEKIMVEGIAIECNPSSNHLIGTFDRYEQHPIFRFNHFGLGHLESINFSSQIRVSVNTDDLGVFDTSIENEYALLFGALCTKRDAMGRPVHSHDEILAYIEHLRTMGNEMTFPKAEKKL